MCDFAFGGLIFFFFGSFLSRLFIHIFIYSFFFRREGLLMELIA